MTDESTTSGRNDLRLPLRWFLFRRVAGAIEAKNDQHRGWSNQASASETRPHRRPTKIKLQNEKV